MFESEHFRTLQGCDRVEQQVFGRVPADWSRQIGCTEDTLTSLATNRIGRHDLRLIWQDSSDAEALFLHTMAWGGMTVRNGKTAWSDRDLLKPLILSMLSGADDRKSIYRKFELLRVKGMGPAYFTKLIHFGTADRCTRPGYIMDQWTAKSVNLLLGKPLITLDRAGYVARSNDASVYEEFCQIIEVLARQVGDNPDQLEERLFSKGKPNPGKWRQYVIANWLRQ